MTRFILLVVGTTGFVLAILSWALSRPRRHQRAPVTAVHTAAEKAPDQPPLTATIAPLRYAGPVAPKSGVVIANHGDSPVHEVIVRCGDGLGNGFTLWNQALQQTVDDLVVGMIHPGDSAVVPASIGMNTEHRLVVSCRFKGRPYDFELQLLRTRRSGAERRGPT